MSNPRNYMMDPTVPRTAPRFPINPTPFNFEKPTPQVPEVSLIFDSSMQSNKPRSNSLPAPLPTTAPQQGGSHCQSIPSQPQPHPQALQYTQQNNFEVRVLYDVIKKQEEAISRLENSVQVMSENQDFRWKNIQGMLNTLLERSSVQTPHRSDQSVQTEAIENLKEVHTPRHVEGKPSPPAETSTKKRSPENALHRNFQTAQISVTNLPRMEKGRSSSSSSSSSCGQEVGNAFGRSSPLPQDFGQKNQNLGAEKEPKGEDLSTILKDLQLPTIQENSIFSEVSIRSIDLQDYNDSFSETKSDTDSPDVGPSASNFGSSSDEEEVKPTVTFYRNVIGNVNKMLEGNQEITMYGSTDTTVYGMSSTNLSFATKQYLQKYGLVKHREAPKEKEKEKVKGSKRSHGRDRESSGNGKENSNDNRILDLNSIRNKPKFI